MRDLRPRWCLFTSAGDDNAIRLWLEGDAVRQWDLVLAYYGDDDHGFSEIAKHCSYAFRTKGSKFQNLKKLVTAIPDFFDRYSHVWVCDDDIQMSATHINDAFELTEMLGFWVAQPALRREGQIFHWITCATRARWDYRIVNFVEVSMPIFQREKLTEFLSRYDGSLTGWGIDHWYADIFKANDFGRFAIIDRIQVTNPHDEKDLGRKIDRLEPSALRSAAWQNVRKKYGLAENRAKVIAYCKLAPKEMPLRLGAGGVALLKTLRRSGWHEMVWLLRCGVTTFRQARSVNDSLVRKVR